MRSLITGIGGFAGGHLTRLLLKEGDEVAGIDLPGSNLAHLGELGKNVQIFHGSMDEAGVAAWALKSFKPQRVFHLAGLARVSESWEARERTVRSNFLAAFHLLEAGRMMTEAGEPPRILLVGSGEQYGLVPEVDQPIRETQPLRPRSPYASAKCAQEALGYQYALGEGLHILMARPFSHIGTGQRQGFVIPDFSLQVARIESGLQEPVIRVGNLSARRDFCHVRDMAKGYLSVMKNGEIGEVYNLGSGLSISIQEILERMLTLSSCDIRVEVDKKKFRPADIPLLVGDVQRAWNDLKWKVDTDFNETLEEILNFWRSRIGGGSREWPDYPGD